DVPTSVEESMPSNSWTELPRSDAERRRSTSSIPRQSGPLMFGGDLVPDAAPRPAGPMRTPVAPLPLAPPPTDSRMGWESHPRPSGSRFPLRKIAMVAGGLAVGLTIWLIAGIVNNKVTPAAAPPIALPAPVVPAPTQMAVQPPPPPPVTEPPPDAADAPPPEVAARDPEPTPIRKPRPAA